MATDSIWGRMVPGSNGVVYIVISAKVVMVPGNGVVYQVYIITGLVVSNICCILAGMMRMPIFWRYDWWLSLSRYVLAYYTRSVVHHEPKCEDLHDVNQWTSLREHLQETIGFSPTNLGLSVVDFPSNQPIE